jgi:hypothetical protein
MVSRKLTTINNLQSLNPKTLGHYCNRINNNDNMLCDEAL